jgi:CheY-like chemotaxis protein
VPIIAMTANAMQGDRERCLAAAMDDYVSKPVRSSELFRAVEEWGAMSPVEPVMEPVTDALPGVVFDEAHFRQSIGDQALMKQLLEIFPEDTESMIRDADAAVADLDVEALYRAVHSLKGMVGNYSAPRASEVIATTCLLAQSGRLDEATVGYRQAREEFRRLADELQKVRQGL